MWKVWNNFSCYYPIDWSMLEVTVVFRILFHFVLPDSHPDQVSVLITHFPDTQIVGGLDVFDVLPFGVTLETNWNCLL